VGVFIKNIKKEHMIYIAVAVIVVIAILAYVLLNSGNCTACGKPVSSAYIGQLQQVANNATLASTVGAGLATPGVGSNLPKAISAPQRIVNGKPEVLYVGGEFCPYCGVTRWGLIVALMRFGTFSNLTYMESDPTDVYPNTATFSFVNSSYQSNYINFDGFEIFNRQEQNQNTSITPGDTYLYSKYSTGIPFIDFANSSVQSGSVVTPGVLRGENWNQVLASINDPSSPTSQAIIGQANVFTAAICRSNETLNMTAPACKAGYLSSITS
jgi:hypothetical protein